MPTTLPASARARHASSLFDGSLHWELCADRTSRRSASRVTRKPRPARTSVAYLFDRFIKMMKDAKQSAARTETRTQRRHREARSCHASSGHYRFLDLCARHDLHRAAAGPELDVRAVGGRPARRARRLPGRVRRIPGRPDPDGAVGRGRGVAAQGQPALFYVVKYIGAAYLAWIGFQMLRGALRSWSQRGEAGQPAGPRYRSSAPRTRSARRWSSAC